MGGRSFTSRRRVKNYRFDELVYWDEKSGTLIIGDLIAENEDGSLGFGPHLFMGVPCRYVCGPLAERLAGLSPKLVLSAHLGRHVRTRHTCWVAFCGHRRQSELVQSH